MSGRIKGYQDKDRQWCLTEEGVAVGMAGRKLTQFVDPTGHLRDQRPVIVLVFDEAWAKTGHHTRYYPLFYAGSTLPPYSRCFSQHTRSFVCTVARPNML